MTDRTREYLRGRTRAYYRQTTLTPPPDADRREWGYIPWAEAGPGMIRHRDLASLGELSAFGARDGPQHVYHSAAVYDEPGAPTMAEKGWRGADLIFDIDAEYVPETAPGEDAYATALTECKRALVRLLSFLEADFGFHDLEIVFSGSRGYHVHVRDPGVRELTSTQRREIADYVLGLGVELDAMIRTEPLGDGVTRRVLPTDGGWPGRVHQRLVTLLDRVAAMDDDTALETLQSYEGVGERRANAALTVARTNREALVAGNLSANPAIVALARAVLDETRELAAVQIDDPVTTDTNRLIRLPGSLHGGSALAVCRIDRADVATFDPLIEAVPDVFRDDEIGIDVTRGGSVELGGETHTLEEGPCVVPEYLALFLMARGRATKV